MLGGWFLTHYVDTLVVIEMGIRTKLSFYKKPRVRGSGSKFLRIPEFESQKFLKFIKFQHLVS